MSIIGSASIAKQSKMPSNAILKLDLNRSIPERTHNVAQNFFDTEAKEAIGMHDLNGLIKKASEDASIKALSIHSSGLSANLSTCYNLLEGLKAFKESGKPILAYGDFFSQTDYMLASVADTIALNPQGYLDIRGFRVMYSYYKDMMEKLGIEMNIFYAGEFKSATEPYRRNDMSEQNRLQSRALIEELYDQYLEEISQNRNLDITALDKEVNALGFRYPEWALEKDMVDLLIYQEEYNDLIRSKIGVEEKKKINFIDIEKYKAKAGLPSKGKSKNKIAVVYTEGTIEYNNKQNGLISEVTFVPILEKLKHKKDIKAVVLRVNSPGGNSYSSDQIWKGIETLKEDSIPVVASFGNYAASGGYYIACNADAIVSEPSSLTGSIGVYSMFPDASRLFNEKLGIHFDTVKTNPYSISFSPMYDLRADEEALMQESTIKIYDLFLDRVSEGRKMDKAAVDKIARGRVWTGSQAVENGLVDDLGSLQDAISLAAEMAGIGDDYRRDEYPKIKENEFMKVAKQLMAGQESSLSISKMSGLEAEWFEQYQSLKKIMENNQPQMRLPLDVKY